MGIAIANTPCISIHAPREGGDRQVCRVYPAVRQHFNPRPPRGGRLHGLLLALVQHDFNPRPPRGGRPRLGAWRVPALRFQSTPPARGATRRLDPSAAVCSISIHAPREGGDGIFADTPCANTGISIHAPREGGDQQTMGKPRVLTNYFNPRPPRGGRLAAAVRAISTGLFQSTPPARGATRCWHWGFRYGYHFNPRPPRGGRHEQHKAEMDKFSISIHAPREGGDIVLAPIALPDEISIHAPREGGDG